MFYMLAGLFPFQQQHSLSTKCQHFRGGFCSPVGPRIFATSSGSPSPSFFPLSPIIPKNISIHSSVHTYHVMSCDSLCMSSEYFAKKAPSKPVVLKFRNDSLRRIFNLCIFKMNARFELMWNLWCGSAHDHVLLGPRGCFKGQMWQNTKRQWTQKRSHQTPSKSITTITISQSGSASSGPVTFSAMWRTVICPQTARRQTFITHGEQLHVAAEAQTVRRELRPQTALRTNVQRWNTSPSWAAPANDFWVYTEKH